MQVNQIRAGAALSYVSMALSTVISLVYTPIMLRQLGDSEFGVYQAVLPIISYLNLLSFGLGSAYVRYYSRFRAAGDKKGCAKLNGMFLITYLILGALVLAIGFGLSYCDVVFGKKLMRIMTVNAALTFPISVFESHVTINERYLFQKIVAMGKQVLNPLIMIPLLLIGYRSVTLTIVSLIFTVLSGVINITYCLTRLKMPFAFRHYDFALLREMFGFTLYVFIGIVVDNINWSIDRQLLTWFHGSTAVTIYVIAAQPCGRWTPCSPRWDGCSSSCWAAYSWASWPSASPSWCCGAAASSSASTIGPRCCCSSPACGPTFRPWASRYSVPRICTNTVRWSIWAY